jgi:poly(glycerol-phosphate) alpha-glucosyltransferase
VRVALLSPSLSRSAGGIFEIVRCLAHALHIRECIEVEALGLVNENWAEDARLWPPVKAECFPSAGPKQFGFSSALRDAVLGGRQDIVHLQALWLYTSIVADAWRRKVRRPLVVTPNGMLEPWALRNSRWRKRLAGLIYERRMLRGAAVLHANTAKELQDFRRFGLTNPVAVIPNGVTMPERTARLDESPRRFVFLGRLHPKKGVRELINAWSQLAAAERGNWRLTIAGWDDGGHEAELRKQAAELDLISDGVAGVESASPQLGRDAAGGGADADPSHPLTGSRPSREFGGGIEFVGPQFGADKEELLASASAFVLPSFSEGLPMAVLEAWSYGLPVVMTEHCNLPEGFAAGAAIRVAPDAASIVTGLRQLLAMETTELRTMGARGRTLVEREFTWTKIAEQMADVYRWALGGGPPPACVETV